VDVHSLFMLRMPPRRRTFAGELRTRGAPHRTDTRTFEVRNGGEPVIGAAVGRSPGGVSENGGTGMHDGEGACLSWAVLRPRRLLCAKTIADHLWIADGPKRHRRGKISVVKRFATQFLGGSPDVRPLLHPSLVSAWRDSTTLQVGVSPGRAVILGGLGPAELAVLRGMDGKNDVATLRALAVAAGGDTATADRVVDLLIESGAAVDGELLDSPDRCAAHQAPDRASLSLVDRSADDGRSSFAARRRKHVEVVGAGRVGAAVARLLAAGGIGDVDVDDQALVTAADVSPAAHPAGNVGIARTRSLHPHLGQGSGFRSVERPAPDFVVLAPDSGFAQSWLTDALLRAGTPHLLVQVTEVTGVVGPLVVPGVSACLRCLDLHRTDRDPGWPTILNQAARKPPSSPACDASVATAVAGLASAQTLAYLDGYDVAAASGTIELELPYGLPRRRSWKPHPECGCTCPEL
jgi:bacteriocin biosynthesis cyclodehydratase domain-containing protein